MKLHSDRPQCLNEGEPISQSSLDTDTPMVDLPSTTCSEASFPLNADTDCDMTIPDMDMQTRYLPDPSVLGWQSPGEQAIQPPTCRDEVQREVHGDYMDLDEHAPEITHVSHGGYLSQVRFCYDVGSNHS